MDQPDPPQSGGCRYRFRRHQSERGPGLQQARLYGPYGAELFQRWPDTQHTTCVTQLPRSHRTMCPGVLGFCVHKSPHACWNRGGSGSREQNKAACSTQSQVVVTETLLSMAGNDHMRPQLAFFLSYLPSRGCRCLLLSVLADCPSALVDLPVDVRSELGKPLSSICECFFIVFGCPFS